WGTHLELLAEMTQESFQAMLHEKLRAAVRLTMTTALDEEIEAYLQAGRYERTPKRQDQRNGYYHRDLGTGLAGCRRDSID
ncbi:MAG: transposase, partial [Caldilineaceae bacterium]|nr:transposase [Caldilineaceae bacterium]